MESGQRLLRLAPRPGGCTERQRGPILQKRIVRTLCERPRFASECSRLRRVTGRRFDRTADEPCGRKPGQVLRLGRLCFQPVGEFGCCGGFSCQDHRLAV